MVFILCVFYDFFFIKRPCSYCVKQNIRNDKWKLQRLLNTIYRHIFNKEYQNMLPVISTINNINNQPYMPIV